MKPRRITFQPLESFRNTTPVKRAQYTLLVPSYDGHPFTLPDGSQGVWWKPTPKGWQIFNERRARLAIARKITAGTFKPQLYTR